MEAIFFKVDWRFFAKAKEFSQYLVVIGRIVPDMSGKVPEEVLVKNLIEIALKKLDKINEFNGDVCENIPQLNEMEGSNPRVVYEVKFKTMEDLMRYRKEMF